MHTGINSERNKQPRPNQSTTAIYLWQPSKTGVE